MRINALLSQISLFSSSIPHPYILRITLVDHVRVLRMTRPDHLSVPSGGRTVGGGRGLVEAALGWTGRAVGGRTMVGGLGLGWVGGVLRRRGGWMGCQYERRMRGEGQAGREGDALGFAGRTARRRVQKSVSDAFERSTVRRTERGGGGEDRTCCCCCCCCWP